MLVFRYVTVQGHAKFTPASNETPCAPLAGNCEANRKQRGDVMWCEVNSEIGSSRPNKELSCVLLDMNSR